MPEILIPEIDTGFVFRKRPVAIPADLRPGWRIAIVVLLLRKCCRQNRSIFERLHVLSWGVRTAESREALLAAVRGTIPPDSLLVRIEPSLNRAVDFALGEGLLRRPSGDKVELTQAGVKLADEIDGTDDAFPVEKQFLSVIGKRATERLVAQMFG
jgi:hypothetical protein